MGESLVSLLRRRAEELGDRTAYVELGPEGDVRERRTYAEVDCAARRIAATLRAEPGDRALLLYPHGIEFIVAFFGCLYAGVVAVPAYPPRNVRGLPRLRSILDDAAPGFLLTTETLLERQGAWLERAPELASLRSLATDGAGADGDPDVWRDPGVTGDSPAFLQYTSGSTSTPKGVRVLHRNLLHNEEMIRRAFGQSEESVIVSWLPLYHDMGLIGGVLQPLYVGARCVLLSPGSFLQKPSRWLRAISEHRATTSGGPDFAYDLCVEKVSPEEIAELDLSSWRVAFDGAEPVHAATLDRFARAFAPAGFDRRAFYPCYGLAEATLFVSGGRVDREPETLAVEPSALQAGRAEESPDGLRLVSSGTAWMGQEIRIVEPDAEEPAPDGAVGEIWVRGPSVADGYWKRPEESERTFGARLAGEPGAGPYLRTGDLGFLRDGELYVTGRLKDLVILHGRNYYPQDLERSAHGAHPALRKGSVAAFTVDPPGGARLVVVQEAKARRRGDTEVLERAAAEVRRAVAEENEIAVHEVVLVAAGQVPRTSSGKIRRSACRAAYLAGELEVLARSGGGARGPAESEPGFEEPPPEALWRGVGPEDVGRRLDLLTARLRREIARLGEVPEDAVPLDQPLPALGIDSLAAIELGHLLGGVSRVSVDPLELLAAPSVDALAREIVDRARRRPDAGEPDTPRPSPEAGTERESIPLVTRHRSLLYLEDLPGVGSLHHLVGLARLRGSLDREAFARAADGLVARHPGLAARLERGEDEPAFRRMHRGADLRVLDPGTEAELRGRLEAEAERPYVLEEDAPLRIRIAPMAEDEHLVLLAVHHLAADFWSVARVVQELGDLYRRERGRSGEPTAVEPGEAASDWNALGAAFEGEELALAGPAGEALRAYWTERFAEPPPVLDLAVAGSRPAVRSFAAGSVQRFLPSADLEPSRASAAARGVTLSAWLLAAFQALLARHGGPAWPVVAVPTAGRAEAGTRSVVGYLVQVVPVMGDLSGDPAYFEIADRVSRSLLDASRHGGYPFARIVEDAGVARHPSRPALAQVLFSYQSVPVGAPSGLEAFALGLPGGRFDLGGLAVESLPVPRRASGFDLELEIARIGDRLAARLVYGRDLFDERTAKALLARYETLLGHAARHPETRLSELPLLTPTERETVLRIGAGPGCDTPADRAGGVPARIRARLEESPDAVALAQGGRSLTYGGLGRRVDEIAGRLRGRGVGRESPVGVLLDRSLDLPAALLAVWWTGGAYVPLDPDYPRERLEIMAQDAGLACLVTTSALADRVPEGGFDVVRIDRPERTEGFPEPPAIVAADDLAYVIYTSGSTGRPKGVQVPHGALDNFVASMAREPGLAPGESLLAVTTVSFDIAALELFVPLARGGRAVLLPRDEGRDPATLAAALDDHRIDVLQATPVTWKLLLAGGWRGRRDLRILCGGEALPEGLAHSLAAAGAGAWNLYGPTETTVWSSRQRLEDDRPVRAGRPLDETRLVVLDHRMEPAPVGMSGEIWIGGTGVARGYRNRPAATAERFVPDPFSDPPGARLYRTGDLGRFDEDGRLEVLGRIDHQVKVRGYRVEPGEIEEALRRRPEVAEVAVVARGEAGEARLVAFVVPAVGRTVEPPALRDGLAEILPPHMVPAAFVTLDSLPLTPNRKVDRQRLPADVPALTSSSEDEGRAPSTPVEEILVRLWEEVLGAGDVRATDDFFARGGHSLEAARLIHAARRALGREIPLHLLLEHPTPRGLAARLAAEDPAPPPIPPLADDVKVDGVPLSFAQERVQLFQRLHPASPAYTLPVEVALEGPLDPGDLERALRTVVRRHEALRVELDVERSSQRLVPFEEGSEPRLRRVDLSGLREPCRRSAARAIARRWAREPFDPEGRLLRTCLLRIGPEEHRLVAVAHHTVADGGSTALFLRDLAAAVAGDEGDLPPVPRSLLDFAAWQREHWRGERLRAVAESAPAAGPVLELPTDRPRSGVPRFRGAVEETALDPDLMEALERFCRRAAVTPFMALLAAFQLYLGRLAGSRRVTVGAPFEQRDREELAEAVGFFVNVLPLEVAWREKTTVGELMASVRSRVLQGFRHRSVPYEAVAALRQAAGAPEPEIRATVSLEPDWEPLVRGGLRWEPRPIPNGTAKFDLGLLARPREGRWTLLWEADRDLFDGVTVRRWADGFLFFLGELTAAEPGARVSEIEALTSAERSQLLEEWAPGPEPAEGPTPVHQRVLEQAGLRPDAVAAVEGDQYLSYGELERRSGRWARFLEERGVRPDVAVGLQAGRTLERLAASLAILRAGGAYLPLDPSSPAARSELMLREAGAPLVLTDPNTPARETPEDGPDALALTPEPPERVSRRPDEPPIDSAHLAYVVFTSGSTGVPKGVMIPHLGLDQLVTWHRRTYAVEPGDRASVAAGLGFDASVWEVWPYWASGATLEVAPDGALRSPAALVAWMERRRITHGFLPTPVAEAVLALDDAGALPDLRHLLTGGDRLHEIPGDAPSWALVNHYGPSECSVVATAAPVAIGEGRGSAPPIGRPLPGIRAYVVASDGRLAPPRSPGELRLGGTALARGYTGRPALTAERFVPDPFGPPGGRLYRTGDLVRHREGGDLDFLGRTDLQIEIRGHRIEPGEIEAVLARHPAVSQAAVATVGEGGALVAWVVPAAGGDLGPEEVVEVVRFAADRLPPYMVPARVIPVERMPLTANGKVDRGALPEPSLASDYAAPRNEVEEVVVEIWRDLLGVDRVGIHDRFTELGGHSLQAAEVASRLGEEFGVELPVGSVLRSPTAAELAMDVVRALVAQSEEDDVAEALAAVEVES